jgi:IMP cyclohydrolase
MYVGRIVAVGRNRDNRLCGLYRVSSRSFPNRDTVVTDSGVAVVPKAGFESDIFKNPYIAYNCLQQTAGYCIVSNGSHTDIITAKLGDGVPVRDVLVEVLHGMDFEHDSLDTPRIAGVVHEGRGEAWLGIVTRTSLQVTQVAPAAGQAFYVATYEHTVPGAYGDDAFDAVDAAAACDHVIGGGAFAELERPVAAACGVAIADGYDVAVKDAAVAE